MLPIPFEKYIPSFFERDEKLTAFADKMDEILNSLKDDTLGLNDLINPFKAPVVVLDILGDYFNAGIKQSDTERIKRIKIATAIQGHKKRGTFEFDVKPKIDAIALGDSSIYKKPDNKNIGWLMVGDGQFITGTEHWASLGTDGITDDLGILLIGEGTEIEIKGNIYIDTDNNSLSAGDIQLIVDDLKSDIVPAYYNVFIGYVDTNDNFVVYAKIE